MVVGADVAWAGIGALLAGCGSALSGWAALRMARNKGREDERAEQHYQEEHREAAE